jgi:hypothetical protein
MPDVQVHIKLCRETAARLRDIARTENVPRLREKLLEVAQEFDAYANDLAARKSH